MPERSAGEKLAHKMKQALAKAQASNYFLNPDVIAFDEGCPHGWRRIEKMRDTGVTYVCFQSIDGHLVRSKPDAERLAAKHPECVGLAFDFGKRGKFCISGEATVGTAAIRAAVNSAFSHIDADPSLATSVQLLRNIAVWPTAADFLYPINATWCAENGYDDIVGSRISLYDVHCSLQRGEYSDRATLDGDIMRVFHNALLFHPAGSLYHKRASYLLSCAARSTYSYYDNTDDNSGLVRVVLLPARRTKKRALPAARGFVLSFIHRRPASLLTRG